MKTRKCIGFALMFVILSWGGPLSAQQSREKVRLTIRENTVGKIPTNLVAKSTHLSPNSQRIAYVIQRGPLQCCVVDGVEGKEYDGIDGETLTFSPDSKRLAYTAGRGGKQFLVLDGVEGTKYNAAVLPTPTFSPDSKKVVYCAEQDGKWRVVVDGAEGAAYAGIVKLSFAVSPDGQRLAYAAQRGGKYVAVIDGVESAPYDEVQRIYFSPDSKRVAYSAALGREVFVVVDGIAQRRNYEGVVFDKRSSLFSPDSKRLVYCAVPEGSKRAVIVVDGEEVKGYDMAVDPHFSPNGQRLAFVANRNNEQMVVVDGVEHKYDGVLVETLCFSPDSQHVFYGFRRGKTYYLGRDGVAEKGYENLVGFSHLRFSPDGQRTMYLVARKDKKYMAVIDGAESKAYSYLSLCGFSADSRHSAYQMEQGGKQYLVIDGKETPGYDAIMRSDSVFDQANTIHFLALSRSRGEILRIDIEVQEVP